MASAVAYTPSTAYSVQAYDDYPYNDRRPEYTPYPSSRPLPQPTQQQQAHQVWNAPPRSSTISYQDPSYFVSPPPVRRSLADDPAFATDPNINPEYWHTQMNVQSTTPFPSHSYSGLDLPHDFVVSQSGPVPNTSPRGLSYHEDPRPVYFIAPSISSSSSASNSSASKSSNVRPPWSSIRNSDHALERAPFRSNAPMEVQYTPPDEGQSQPRNGKHRAKRRTPHSAQPAKDHAASHAEAAGVTIIPSTVEKRADGAPRTLMSSMTITSPPDVSEHPKDSRVRTSSRPTPPDLDPIDHLDKTNPLGFNVHHKGPYEAVAAILNETNPLDSPLLRQQMAQKQVSSGTRIRRSRHIKSELNANPMSLNLQPGQILPNSIYQPTQPSHFPAEFGQGTHPSSQDFRVSRKAVEYPAADYDTANSESPLRRNQTLPAPSMARGTSGQLYQEPPPLTSEVLPYQRQPSDSNFHQRNLPQPLPIDSVPSRSGRGRMSQPSASPLYATPPSYSHPPQSTGADHAVTNHSLYADMPHNSGSPSQITPIVTVSPPDAPPYQDLDQQFSRTLYLTNPDEARNSYGHRPHGSPMPTAPEMVHPNERRSERPRRSHHSSFYGGQPSLAVPRRPTDAEGRRRRASHGSPLTAERTSEQDSPRRYEPPSRTLAASNAQYVAKAPSTSSSSRTSSSLTPRHVPKRLVMPTPLSNAARSAPLTAPPAAVISRGNAGRPGQGQVLRKRNSRVETHRPQRRQSLPPQTVKGGIFSFLKFGKGPKPMPVVREVRFSEPSKVGTNEKGDQRGRTRDEPRKLSKRRP